MQSALDSDLRDRGDLLVTCRCRTGTDKSLPSSISDSFDQQINESHRHLVYIKKEPSHFFHKSSTCSFLLGTPCCDISGIQREANMTVFALIPRPFKKMGPRHILFCCWNQLEGPKHCTFLGGRRREGRWQGMLALWRQRVPFVVMILWSKRIKFKHKTIGKE